MNNYFNLSRTIALMRHDIEASKRTIWITCLALIALMVLMPTHVTQSGHFYYQQLFIGGFILTSMAFKELADPQRATLYLTLPASNLERFLSKWFLTSIGYAVVMLAINCGFALLSVVVGELVFHKHRAILNPLDAAVWMNIGQYVILHSVVFLGAVTFKRNVLIKTTFSLALLSILISVSMMLFTYIFCPDCFLSGFVNLLISSFDGANFLFWVVLAPFCLGVTYLKLTEVEIS